MTSVDMMLELWQYKPGDKVIVNEKQYTIVSCETCGCNILDRDFRCWNCHPYRIRKKVKPNEILAEID